MSADNNLDQQSEQDMSEELLSHQSGTLQSELTTAQPQSVQAAIGHGRHESPVQLSEEEGREEEEKDEEEKVLDTATVVDRELSSSNPENGDVRMYQRECEKLKQQILQKDAFIEELRKDKAQVERLKKQLTIEQELNKHKQKIIEFLEENVLHAAPAINEDREKELLKYDDVEYLKQEIFHRENENGILKSEAQLLRDQMIQQQATIESLQTRMEELSMSPGDSGLPNIPLKESGITVKLPLFYQQCNGVPTGFHYGQCVVYDQRYLLYGGGVSTLGNMHKIYCFNFRRTSWSEFSTYSYERFCMAVVRNRLFVVGGYNSMRDEYSSFVSEWKDSSWVQMKEHPLPISRCGAVAIGYKSYLVVAGGFNGVPLDRVDVLDVDTLTHWHTLAPLPQPGNALQSCWYRTNSTTIWYLMATSKEYVINQHKPIFAVSLKDLINGTSSWKTIPDAPLANAGAVVMKGYLMAVGGHDQHAIKKDLHMYFPGTNEWLKVGELQHAHHSTTCVSLSEKKFVVIGGKEEETEYSCRVHQYNLRQQ